MELSIGGAEVVDGLDDLKKALEQLRGKVKWAVASAAIRAGLTTIGREMRKQLDPKAKQAARAIRTRVKRTSKGLVAKVGFGVGPRNRKSRSTPPPRGRKPGVGIGANNIHWWIQGTSKRITKRGQNRGSMPAMQPGLAGRAAIAASGRAAIAAEQAARKQIVKQIEKIRKG